MNEKIKKCLKCLAVAAVDNVPEKDVDGLADLYQAINNCYNIDQLVAAKQTVDSMSNNFKFSKTGKKILKEINEALLNKAKLFFAREKKMLE